MSRVFDRNAWPCGAACLALLLLAFGIPVPGAYAEQTTLRVLVRSHDAKFIGSGVGGIAVTVRDSASGEVLGGGEITGGTGDTDGLMQRAMSRGAVFIDAESASFELAIDIDRPRRVEVSASGPLGFPQSRQQVTQTLWLLPGQHRAAVPLVLEMGGLVLDLIDLRQDGRDISLTGFVAMLCGCPVTEDGLWPVSDFAVTVQLYEGRRKLLEQAMAFTGDPSVFAVSLTSPVSGSLELVLQALQHSTGNVGVYRLPLEI